MATETTQRSHHPKKLSWRGRLFRIWLFFAAPWFTGVVTMSIYDHLRAIRRMVDLHVADQGLSGIQVAGQWLIATLRYSGEAILFYGILPVSVTFILYVMFLPWADKWSRQGLLED